MADIDKIKTLRDSTGLSFGEIKKALEEAGGDEQVAKEILNKLGVKMAEKKAARTVKEGVIQAYVHNNKKQGAMVELFCETDFVAKNMEFQKLAYNLAMHITAMKPGSLEELLAQPFVKEPDISIRDLVNKHIAKLGENIQIGRFEVLEI